MVRQIMVDLETGDFCQQEKQSYLRDIENLRKLISIREKEHGNTVGRLNDCQGVVKEKNIQIQLKEDEIKALKKEKGAKFWSGIGVGAGSSLALVAVLLLL